MSVCTKGKKCLIAYLSSCVFVCGVASGSLKGAQLELAESDDLEFEAHTIRAHGPVGTKLRLPEQYIKRFGDKSTEDGSYNFVSLDIPIDKLAIFRRSIKSSPKLFTELSVSLKGSSRDGVAFALQDNEESEEPWLFRHGAYRRVDYDYDLVNFKRITKNDEVWPVSHLIPKRGERYRELYMLCTLLHKSEPQYSCFVSSAINNNLMIQYQLPIIYLAYWEEFDNDFRDLILHWIVDKENLQSNKASLPLSSQTESGVNIW